MKLLLPLAFPILIGTSAPAFACLPPLTETKALTAAEKAESIFKGTTNIVYGVVTGYQGGMPRFKVRHVYKGNLRAGQTILAPASHGFYAPACFTRPAPAAVGEYGVIAFSDEPRLNYVDAPLLELMFEAGWIASARRAKINKPARHNTR